MAPAARISIKKGGLDTLPSLSAGMRGRGGGEEDVDGWVPSRAPLAYLGLAPSADMGPSPGSAARHLPAAPTQPPDSH